MGAHVGNPRDPSVRFGATARKSYAHASGLGRLAGAGRSRFERRAFLRVFSLFAPIVFLLLPVPGLAQSAGHGANGATGAAQPQPSASSDAQTGGRDTAQGGKTPTLTVDVKVVTLPVTVRDKHGQIVRNLTKDDFDLQEDGHPQTIRYFTQETNLPLTLGLLVDTSMSQRNILEQERTAGKTFLDEMVTNKDHAFVIHFDREVELLQDLTADHSKLEAALQLLETPGYGQQTGSSGGSGSGSSRASRGGGTLLYDSIFLAADELMQKQTGRKAIVVLSDGVDRGSKESLASAIEAAQRADTIVYAVYFAGNEQRDGQDGFGRRGGGGMGRYPGGGYPGGGYPGGYPGGGYPGGYPGGGYPGGGYPGGRGGGQRSPEPHIDGKKMLEQIAATTGGHLYEVSKKNTLDRIYGDIAEELRTQYLMGYTPAKSDVEGYHAITLTTKKKDLTVQTRAGYYTGH